MLHKTRGIALSYIRYRETSIIAKIYTESFGMQSYIVNSVRSSRSKSNKIALFQPLTLLDLVVYHKNKADSLHRISELKCLYPFHSVPFLVIKSSLALFLTELLTKCLREEEENLPLFDFLQRAIVYLDEAESGFENFHLHVLTQLAFYLGFGLETTADFSNELRSNHYPQSPDASQNLALHSWLTAPFGVVVALDRPRRISLLNMLLFFYKIHLDSLGEIKSLDVLHEVLS
ncbi:DNA repair protein RecO [Arundinibacter roseus]|uniref:DNA repair protein RecO n=1 Tax=Arundinibacter roseus TaxID=2070510 RepID=A0A4R4KLE7_9BACT|nr:DNA repair protein RecO [Arundinibacter roseus]TDB69187.1 DNA repair protein RecO [Arundinibacter roseus]